MQATKEHTSNIERLRAIMDWHGLRAKDVGALIHRTPATVRNYMCGSSHIPDSLLRVLTLKIEGHSCSNMVGECAQ